MRKIAPTLGLAFTVALVSVTSGATDEPLIVAKVGPVEVSAAELTRRLEAAPRIQMRYLGADGLSAQRAFLERTVVRELLWSQLAEARGLHDEPGLRGRIDAKLAAAAAAGVLEAHPPAPVTDDEVQAHYDLQIDRYQTPATLTLWHILVASEAEARAVIEDMEARRDAKTGTYDVKRWAALARQHSLDERTKARSGNLGVVRPDGTSSAEGVVVEKSILDAAQRVEDLELVPNPVPVGERFSVVWRRKGVGGMKRPLSAVATSIRTELETARRVAALQAWMDEQVKVGRVEQYRPELLDF